ncbi:MAG TPA: hybrid sensor histidine kinase/response regulator [Azospirillaceae bacterium]|nr:hybrid sensor histidine kinase/response regulator [Azospirillaceae bacterium]
MKDKQVPGAGGSAPPISIIASTDAAALIFDADGRLVSWSPAAEARAASSGMLVRGLPRSALGMTMAAARTLDLPLSDGNSLCLLQPSDEETEVQTRARGRFLATAGHNLRQPLSALSLLAGALETRVHDPAGRDILKAMGSAVQAMKGLVETHLELAKLDAGTLRPEVGEVAVNSVLTRLAMELLPRFEERRLRFSAEPCSAVVRSDRGLLERILGALAANALRCTDHGRVLVGARRRGNELRLEVWDTGRGIAPEELATIREEFARPALPGQPGGAGFGLGLSLVWRLAGLLGHRLEVDSRPGRGSVFAVVVPLAVDTGADAPATPAAPDPGPTDLTRARVLVIDDDRLVLDALTVLLEQWGCEVVPATAFEEAHERVMNGGALPDLIVADFRLKGSINGIGAIRLLCQAMERAVPGLILTGDTDPTRLREARLSGYPLLHKPVTPLALRTNLAHLLGRERLEP